MKKSTLIILSLALLSACQPKEEGLEAKKAKLEEKEKALADLQGEIKTLRAELLAIDTTATEESLTPVSIMELQPKAFSHFVGVTGTISSDENVLLSAETNGRVVSIPVKEGQMVSRGQTLVKINSEAIESQLAEARAAFNLAETTFERRKRLWNDSIGSEIEFLNAKTNFEASKNRLGQLRAMYDNSIIKAPVGGKVDEISVNVGEFVGAGVPVVRVIDMDNLEVEAELSENYLSNVKVGDSVLVKIPALGLEQMQPITFAGQYINPDNRSFKIKVDLDNKSKLLKPNLLAELNIQDYKNSEALVVPAIAIKQDLKGRYVYVVKTNGNVSRVEKRYVKAGRSFSDETEILNGLETGDSVITAGFNQVSAGEKVVIK